MFFKLFQKMILIQYTYKYNYLRNFNKNIIIIIQYYKSQFKYYRFLTQKRNGQFSPEYILVKKSDGL